MKPLPCGITFRAWQDRHYITIAEILVRLGARVLSWHWTVSIEEVALEGQGKDLLLADDMQQIDIFTLLHWVTPQVQIIDGTFTASDKCSNLPQMQISCIRGDDWDIRCLDNCLLDEIHIIFRDAVRITNI